MSWILYVLLVLAVAFLLHINIVELGTEVHFHGCNIFSPQLLLLFFLRRCQPLCFRLAGKFVNSLYINFHFLYFAPLNYRNFLFILPQNTVSVQQIREKSEIRFSITGFQSRLYNYPAQSEPMFFQDST